MRSLSFRPVVQALVVLSILAVSVIRAEPQVATKCTNPIVRKEWRTLSKKDRLSYLNAVKCILAKPPLTPASVSSGVGSRYEDFVVPHIQQTMSIHFVGHFLPWHRFMTAVYEQTLRNECGYNGAQPYWDWTLDVNPSSKFTKSPVWDPVYGFGGNGPFVPLPNDTIPGFEVPGRTGGGCVVDGPFKDMVVRLGPQGNLDAGHERCLTRDFSPYFAGRYVGKNVTEQVISQSDYGWFSRALEGSTSFEASSVHGGGHFSVGGTLGIMGDLFNSPSDPVFYLHHANLDRLWWSWQKRDLAARLDDISGPINILDYENLVGGNVTLAFPLSLGLNAPNVTVRDVMDIHSPTLCYHYDELY